MPVFFLSKQNKNTHPNNWKGSTNHWTNPLLSVPQTHQASVGYNFRCNWETNCRGGKKMTDGCCTFCFLADVFLCARGSWAWGKSKAKKINKSKDEICCWILALPPSPNLAWCSHFPFPRLQKASCKKPNYCLLLGKSKETGERNRIDC